MRGSSPFSGTIRSVWISYKKGIMGNERTGKTNADSDKTSAVGSSADDIFASMNGQIPEDPSYPKGLHHHVPEFNIEDELSKSKYTSQMEALYWLLRGDNVILCGSAGAGKSWVIDKYQEIIHGFQGRLESEGRHLEVAVTASTGAAAALIFGRTIHSWSGLGISVDEFDEDKLHNREKRVWLNAKKRIRDTDVLIVDEVSMLPAYFLSNLDRACRKAKGKSDVPFGGLQVVLVGDFLQLPPVNTNQLDSEGKLVDGGYCFHARDVNGHKIFSSGGFRFCYLDRTRRSSDSRLNDLLNGIRDGKNIDELRALIYPRFHVTPDKGKVYTRLRTFNRSVDNYNQSKLDALPGMHHFYPLKRSGDPDDCKEIINSGKLKPLELKTGAVVMLTLNGIVNGYVNGSMGEVVELSEEPDGLGRKIPIIKVRMNSLPSDMQVIDTSTMTDEMSRDMRTVTIGYAHAKKTHIEVRKDVDDNGGLTLKEVEIVDATVGYVPLRLAWAITVHKSQGQTLDGAVINLSTCFQKGLGYVALSRCKSIDDVIMEGDDMPDEAFLIDPEAKKADNAVKKRALLARQDVMDNEARVKDLYVALSVASSQTARSRIEARIGRDVSLEEMFRDEETCYQYVKKNRARILRRKNGYE
jgi:hypothetical protein